MPRRQPRLYATRQLRLRRTEQLDNLTRASGELYTRVIVSFWRVARKKRLWLGSYSLARWHTSPSLHSHSSDAVVEAFFAALNAWRRARRRLPTAKPPYRRRYYYPVLWKSEAIHMRDGCIVLSNGRTPAPLVLPWTFPRPRLVRLRWNAGYILEAIYEVSPGPGPTGDAVAGVDIGEVHLASTYDGRHARLVNGRYLRAIRRYQFRLETTLNPLLSRKQRGSRRWRRLKASRQRQMTHLHNQVRDILGKQMGRLVTHLYRDGVAILAVGDLRHIRIGRQYGRVGNRRLNSLTAFAEVRTRLAYRSRLLGLSVEVVPERFTTQTCPACGARHRPKGRMYKCNLCGFSGHRDIVGAVNIRNKYLGSQTPVTGDTAAPVGMRYHPHA